MRSFKRILAFVLCVIVTVAIIRFLDVALYPCTYLRNDVHEISVNPPDVLILGTSNAKMGIDPDHLLAGTEMTGHNLAAGSEYPVDSYYLAMLSAEKKKPKMIIYDVDPAYFTTEKENGNNYVLFYHEFPLSVTKFRFASAILRDSDIREWLFPFYEYPLKTVFSRVGDNLSKKFSGDYSIDSLKNNVQEYHENGFIEKHPVKEERFSPYRVDEFKEELIIRDNIEYLDKLIKMCDENDIEFIAITMPLPDKTIEDNKENLTNAWSYFSTFFESRGVEYYNFNTDRYNSYSHRASHYVDYDGHLNGDSAREFSGLFGEILKYNGQLD